jgi:hypothetical protein
MKEELPVSNPPANNNYWRGAGAPLQSGGVETLDQLTNVSWFFNWSFTGSWEDPRYMPMVYGASHANQLDQLASYASNYPGKTWLIFNEPDISEQANLTPAEGAGLYAAVYDAIKGADPTAKLFCCGTAFANTQWLEEFRQFDEVKTRPVDGIHFHGYPCPLSVSQNCLASPDYTAFNSRFDMVLMKQKLNAFYSYLQSRSEFAGKPVWLTEIGILSGTHIDTRQEVKTGVMDPLINYLENEGGWQKFERVAWFSTRDVYLDASDLTKDDNSLTVLGQRWNTCSNP